MYGYIFRHLRHVEIVHRILLRLMCTLRLPRMSMTHTLSLETKHPPRMWIRMRYVRKGIAATNSLHIARSVPGGA